MSEKFVSVILPVYNRSVSLSRAIDSVLSQVPAPDELIVVDDGSEEDLSPILSRYAGRIVTHRQPNGGAASARNAGARLGPMVRQRPCRTRPDEPRDRCQAVCVTDDAAYDTRKYNAAIAERGAAAVIPPCKNAKPWKAITAGAVARTEALQASKYLSRALKRR